MVDITQDARAMMRIKIAAEQCKIALSRETHHLVELPFLCSGKNGEPTGFSETITRSAFQYMIREMIESTGTQIKTALFDADLTAEDIGLTLLLGGSTRIPFVSRFLSEQFSFSPATAVNPDLTVVCGAAIQAGVLGGVLDENAIVLTDAALTA